MKKIDILAKLALLTTAILWGTSLTVVKTASATFKPNFILGIRFVVAAIILSVIFHKKFKLLNKKNLISGLTIGFFLFIAYSSQTLGVTFTSPGRSGFLSASYCVIVPFLFWIVDRTKPDKYNIIAAIFCIIGIFFVAMANDSGSLLPTTYRELMGDGLALLSGLLFASHIVSVAKLSRGNDPVLMTILQFISAGILAWITSFIFEDNSHIVLDSYRPVYEVLYLAVMCTAIALLFQNIGQKYTDPNSAAIILGFESIFGVIFPFLLGMEEIGVKSLVGFVLIFCSIIISETKLSFLKKKFVK